MDFVVGRPTVALCACNCRAGWSCIIKMLVRELGRRTAVNNDCLNAQEISDTVIAGCNMGQICPQGQHRINQHPSNHTSAHTHTQKQNYCFTNQSDPPSCLFNRRESKRGTEKKEGRTAEHRSVCEKKERRAIKDLKKERGERDGEGRKEDKCFNNSQTPASFRIKSVPKLDPCVFHTWHVICSSLALHAQYVLCMCVWACKTMYKHGGILCTWASEWSFAG